VHVRVGHDFFVDFGVGGLFELLRLGCRRNVGLHDGLDCVLAVSFRERCLHGGGEDLGSLDDGGRTSLDRSQKVFMSLHLDGELDRVDLRLLKVLVEVGQLGDLSTDSQRGEAR
jgi:hypothetical protein